MGEWLSKDEGIISGECANLSFYKLDQLHSNGLRGRHPNSGFRLVEILTLLGVYFTIGYEFVSVIGALRFLATGTRLSQCITLS